MQARHHSQLYRQIREVDPRDYQRIIRTYEEREAEIGKLAVLEHFELTTYYADALFATGAYRQHQMMVDLVIEICMLHNIREVEGIEEDIFQHHLLKKAASAFRLQQYDVACHVAKEMIRITPRRELTVRFLRAALFRQQRATLQQGRAGFLFCMLLAAAVVTFELLFLQSFYPNFVPYSQRFIGLTFGTGVLWLVGFYGFAYGRAHHQAYGFQRAAQNK